MISLIACIGKNRGLGKDNQLLYKIPADMKFFKETTAGHTVVMGKNTFLSIGRPLPNRTNIVITRDPNFKAENVIVCNSIHEALQKARSNEEVMVIGGAQIYAQTIGKADKLYLTVVDDEKAADAFFPNYSEFKKTTLLSQGEFEGLKYQIFVLEKQDI